MTKRQPFALLAEILARVFSRHTIMFSSENTFGLLTHVSHLLQQRRLCIDTALPTLMFPGVALAAYHLPPLRLSTCLAFKYLTN